MVTLIKNTAYTLHHALKTPKKQFWESVKFVANDLNKSRFSVVSDILRCSILYSTSFMDYFLLRFFRKSREERKAYAGTGFMYEYQLRMNPKSARDILSDKVKFLQHYADFVGRAWFQMKDFDSERAKIEGLIEKSKKLVLKDSKGQAGKEVEVIDVMPYGDLKIYMRAQGFDLLEEFVDQHTLIQKLAPRGLNTIRIITQLTSDGNVEILGTIFRLSIESNTDNLSVGNAAANIDVATGVIDRPAVYGDFRKEDINIHPVSSEKIQGFKIPFWQKTLDLVTTAAKNSGRNRSIGWDVAITESGPILIEGNHNWGRTLWQLPVDRGLKYMLEKYL